MRQTNLTNETAYRFVELVGLASADGPGTRTERQRGCCWWALWQRV